MANYISKNIISQAYIHIEIGDLTDEEIEKIRNSIEDFVSTRSRFFLNDTIESNVEFRTGSLKIYATIMGTLLGLYEGVSKYTDFKASVKEIYSDVHELSDYISKEIIFITKAKRDDRIRIESRTGVIGSLNAIIDKIDTISSMTGKRNPNDIAQELKDLSKQINKLISVIKSQEDKELIIQGIADISSKIPEKPIPKDEEKLSALEILAYDDGLKKFYDSLSLYNSSREPF